MRVGECAVEDAARLDPRAVPVSAPIAGVHVSARRTHLDAAKPDTSGEIMHIGEVGRFRAANTAVPDRERSLKP